MFYQIKIIRKGTKPPVWRRALVPSNITFAQLAIIMETITNVCKSSKYEFEFYQKKHKILEILPDAKHEYSYTLKNAADFFIDEYLQNESWFNFRINDSLEPEYRVEIEKSIPEVRFRDGILKYPLVIKQVSDKDDSYWMCNNGINEILREKYKIFLSDNSNQKYLNMKELVSLVDEQGIIQDKEANNNNDKTILSMTKYMEDLGKAIMDKYTNPERFQNLMNKF